MESNDLISREEAINGFYEMASNMDHLCTVSDYVSFLESLSPVEPEIIRCKDCKHREYDEDFGYMCEYDTGDPYCTGRNAEDDKWFCTDAERREDERFS